MASVKIIELPIERWQEYKDLRLTMLKLYPQSYGSSFEESSQNPDQKWKELLENTRPRSSKLLFAEVSGQIVGMICAVYYDHLKEQHKATIVGVGVLPKFQGHGIGRKLMSAIMEKIESDPKIRRIDIGVTSTQEAAIKLYQNMGFIKTGEFLRELLVDGKFYDVYEMEKLIN